MRAEETSKGKVSHPLNAFIVGIGIVALASVLINVRPVATSAQQGTPTPMCAGKCEPQEHKGQPWLKSDCSPATKPGEKKLDGIKGKDCTVSTGRTTTTGKCMGTGTFCAQAELCDGKPCKQADPGGMPMPMMPMEMPMMPMSGMPPMLPMLPMPMPMPDMPMPMEPSADPCQQPRATPTDCPDSSLGSQLLNSAFGGLQTLTEAAGGAVEAAGNFGQQIIGSVRQLSGDVPDNTGGNSPSSPGVTIIPGTSGDSASLGAGQPNQQGPSVQTQDLWYAFNPGATGFGAGSVNTVTPSQNTSVLGTVLSGLSSALNSFLGLFL